MLGILWQVAAAVDSQAATSAATAAQHGATAEVVVKNPVPGFVGRVFQFLFSLPQWIQWSAIALGIIAGIAVVSFLFIRREVIIAWITAQSTGYKMGLGGVAVVMLLGAAGLGYAGNHYTQHNNDFCVGCHVMGDAWGAFQKSEHRKLQCHSCHRQPMTASIKQLYYWVAERPSEIPKHAKVPTNVCAECHIQNTNDSTWKRISATAGHRLHMNSDSASLKGVGCVTCHGTEVHRFKSVDKTCGQSNCHAPKDTKIVLGKMAGQSSQHCTGCHTFTRAVPENISMDSTRKFLVANGSPESCFGCHAMKQKLADFEPARDRGHKAVCGSCHNPHKQTEPKMAFQSCANNGCHSDLSKKSPFHSGLSAHATTNCGQCHKAHEWKAVGRECIDCHKNIFNMKPTSAPPVQKRGDADGSAAPAASTPSNAPASITLHPAARRVPDFNSGATRVSQRGRRVTLVRRVLRIHAVAPAAVPVRAVPVRRQQPPAKNAAKGAAKGAATTTPATAPNAVTAQQTPKDNPQFSHGIHKVLACADCHDAKSSHGGLKVRTATECAACHHSAERSVTCEGCHNARTQLARTFTRSVTMRTSTNSPPETRKLPFVHRNHRDLECKGCHTDGLLLSVTRDCKSCHTDHHNAERACTTCHESAKVLHQRASHDGCAGSGCHSNAAVLALPPSRSVCLSCHTDQVNHKPKRECAECHAVKWGTAATPPR